MAQQGAAWAGSSRSARLPSDWRQRVTVVRDRAAGQCEWVLPDRSRCPDAGTDCDHVARGDDHRLANLQWLCAAHHRVKTQAEAKAARWPTTERRPAGKHPGLV